MKTYNFNKSKCGTHSLIISEIPDAGNILDVGCNEGYIGSVFQKSKNCFYGIDFDPQSLILAQKQYCKIILADLNTSDIEKLSLDDNFFDVIIFGDILEHLMDPLDTLNRFKRYLKPDGKIIVSLPNIANFSIRFKLLFGSFDYTETGILDRTHLHFYTIKSAMKLVKDSDYKIEKIKYGSNLFGYLINRFRLFSGLLAYNIIIVAKKQ
ncbi:class I SAM-dependent methyltransferase [Methanococcoides sp. LMO-2]|uniref:Class I SAM-dependent methyltransferase n=1 Tax=Methanococcoides cohabitans TaxID=3136559 RepID=A0ABU9KQ70_9EURY